MEDSSRGASTWTGWTDFKVLEEPMTGGHSNVCLQEVRSRKCLRPPLLSETAQAEMDEWIDGQIAVLDPV